MGKVADNLSLIAKFAGIVLPILFIITSLIINTAYREALFLLGLNQIHNMQSRQSSFLNVIENIFSLLGNPIIVVIVLAIQLFVVKQRIRSLIHIIYITGAFYYVAVIKQTIQQSRPFWYDNDIAINEWFCPTDFGNPSGHSFIVILAYEPILSDFVGTGPKHVLLGIWAVFSALVLISRMYLGAHSLDQIIFGGLLGFAFLIIYKYQFQKMMYSAVTNILSLKNKKLYLIINTLLFVMFLVLPIVEYLINSSNRPVDIADLNNINSKCSKDLTSDSLQQKNLRGTSLGFVALGLFYGLILLDNKNREDVMYLTGKWKYREKKSVLYLLLTIIAIAGIPAGVLALVIPALSSVAILDFICTCLGAAWASFCLVYVLSLVQNKYHWISYEEASID